MSSKGLSHKLGHYIKIVSGGVSHPGLEVIEGEGMY